MDVKTTFRNIVRDQSVSICMLQDDERRVGGWNWERFEEGSTALGYEERWVDGIRRGLKRAVLH